MKEYIHLANKLASGHLSEAELAAAVTKLPALNHHLLVKLANQAEKAALRAPRLGWAIAAVADKAAQGAVDIDPLLQAKAAWFLGRAANTYVRPHMAAMAIERAQTTFSYLGQREWLAACDWQRNALPWALPKLLPAITELKTALTTLSQAEEGLTDLAKFCQLTLAYTQVLAGDFASARQNLDLCEEQFANQLDRLNQARCWLIWGNALRRQSAFSEAIIELEKAFTCFQKLSTVADAALAQCQLAYAQCHQRLDQNHYEIARANFMKAAGKFEQLDLPFWLAYCRNGLAQIYITTGHLSEAGAALDFVRSIYKEYNVAAPQSSALIESGWLEMYRGNYHQSLEYLVLAENLSRKVGNAWLHATGLMHLGEATFALGRYQQALQYLEQALNDFQILRSPSRLAECELRLARCWTQLGKPEQAHESLDQAEKYAQLANQPIILPYLYNWRAEAYFTQNKEAQTITALQMALSAAQQQEDPLSITLAQRLLGETLCATGQLKEAREYLQVAEASFSEMGMMIEKAACQIALGHYYRQIGNTAAAQSTWQNALDLVQDVAPDIVWRAHAGLAELAEATDQLPDALEHYRLVVQALEHPRRGMWQPNLAGLYFSRSSPVLDRAVSLAARTNQTANVLSFIEAAKAKAVADSFGGNNPLASVVTSPELANLTAEIRWLQEHLRASFSTNSWLGTPVERRLRQELRRKVQQYDLLRGQLERRQIPKSLSFSSPSRFNLEHFRQVVIANLGEKWLALDYYQTDDQIITTVITATDCKSWCSNFSGRARLALTNLARNHLSEKWSQRDLETLGQWLLPDAVLSGLSPDTVVFIAPHRQLHRLPWSALVTNQTFLVDQCIPVVIPSLYSLVVLWQRPKAAPLRLENGLLLAIADFEERHPSLPQAITEVEALNLICYGSHSLYAEAASWMAIQQLAANQEQKAREGLARFSFLHVATHAFYDSVTGRLSGLALSDRDVWLDELWDCAPLPGLVTLAACGGSKSLLYEGDEHVGLATTCLATGARHVVASLWPVSDQDVALLMVAFYRYLADGHMVAAALALAQREAQKTGKALFNWAGFLCTGLP